MENIITMTDETLSKIKQVSQRLSDLVALPYTDFYKADRFVALFELPINSHPTYSTISEIIFDRYLECFNRISFLERLCEYIEKETNTDKVIRAIQREFKGLGG